MSEQRAETAAGYWRRCFEGASAAGHSAQDAVLCRDKKLSCEECPAFLPEPKKPLPFLASIIHKRDLRNPPLLPGEQQAFDEWRERELKRTIADIKKAAAQRPLWTNTVLPIDYGER